MSQLTEHPIRPQIEQQGKSRIVEFDPNNPPTKKEPITSIEANNVKASLKTTKLDTHGALEKMASGGFNQEQQKTNEQSQQSKKEYIKIENFYDRLGVSPNATREEIQQAYRRHSIKLHPDTNSDPLIQDEFKDISDAYNRLKDPVQRATYDTLLAREKEQKEKRSNGKQTAQEQSTSSDEDVIRRMWEKRAEKEGQWRKDAEQREARRRAYQQATGREEPEYIFDEGVSPEKQMMQMQLEAKTDKQRLEELSAGFANLKLSAELSTKFMEQLRQRPDLVKGTYDIFTVLKILNINDSAQEEVLRSIMKTPDAIKDISKTFAGLEHPENPLGELKRKEQSLKRITKTFDMKRLTGLQKIDLTHLEILKKITTELS